MWGVSLHGKNHTRAMGCHWASYLSYLSAALISFFAFPCFSGTDSENIANLLLEVQLLRSTAGSIKANTDDLFYIQLYTSDIREKAGYIPDIYTLGVEIEALLEDVIDRVVSNDQVRVSDNITHDKLDTLIDTNQYYLAAILEELKRPINSPFSASFLSDSMVHGRTYLQMYQDIWYDSTNFYWQLLNRDFGLWQAVAMQPFFDYDFSQLEGRNVASPNLGKEKYEYFNIFKTIYGAGDPNHDASFQNVSSFFTGGLGKLKMKYYGTYHITDALTNTVLTLDSNGHTITNKALLDQILSSGQYQALYRDNINQFTNGVVPTLGNAVDANTNGMFIGSYASPTNADMLASITTNDYVNTDYDSFMGDLNENNLNDKLDDAGFVDFDSKLDDAFSDTLTALESAQGNDWVIRLGNVTLGDWSYTIPDITVPHSDSWMALMRKFFTALKAICIIAFFLFLWNKLRQVAAETS